MAYIRVLPRDLFNESSLLKCLGALWIALDNLPTGHTARFVTEDVPAFHIVQDDASGGLMVANIVFTINGTARELVRPLNSRQPWPLWVEDGADGEDFDDVEVFTDAGALSAEFLALIGAAPQRGA